ncbi:UNVERIFIED_CONTAM: hypothetical protein Sradi_6141100 [Sesamum radiatum]|uniref:Uncharacterized protein n=1 Tax=Sesamum radiatum TaxID=300843 RepID=A0AAW2KNN6_SESRA
MSFRKFLMRWQSCCRPELPKKLPPRRAIGHAIELEPGARPPGQAPTGVSRIEEAVGRTVGGWAGAAV